MMFARWTEILPVFIFRWLAVGMCERFTMEREGHTRIVVVPRPGIYIKVKQ